jgi:hypothetical protein
VSVHTDGRMHLIVKNVVEGVCEDAMGITFFQGWQEDSGVSAHSRRNGGLEMGELQLMT